MELWADLMTSACGRRRECVTRKLDGMFIILWCCTPFSLLAAWVFGRLKEAIECLKRALITADAHEITINLRLARLHGLLEEHAEAVAYHQRIVEVCQADC